MNLLPPYLSDGDKVALIAPAGYVDKNYIEHMFNMMSQFNLQIVEGLHLYKRYNQFAGTDNERYEDLQWALNDEDIKAIFCARGGYGIVRIIDKVNWELFQKKPKWVCGFSDISILHSQINKLGFCSLHCAMPINFKAHHSIGTPWIEQIAGILKGGVQEQLFTGFNDQNEIQIEGELIGGNLSILYSLLGTPYDLDYTHKILFIEDVGEHYYKIDRMIQSLKLAGKLKMLKAILLGSFTEMSDNKRPFGKSIEEIILEAVETYSIPVIKGIPSGHREENYPLVLGTNVLIECTKNNIRINRKN